MRRLASGLVLVLLVLATPAPAQAPGEVRIDISGAGRRIRLLVEPMSGLGNQLTLAPSRGADEVLAHDLEGSGVVAVGRAWTAGQPGFEAQAVVGGRWTVQGNQVRLQGEVKDLPARRSILSKEYRGAVRDWRSVVHRFADDVVLQFTGEPGVSSTRIAFSVVDGRMKELYVMDYDGARLAPLTADKSIAMSPSWAPDGSLILFTSYRGGAGPRVFVVTPAGGRAHLVSGRPGLNTSAAYSPDGREIALTLSQDGNSEVYLVDARGGSPRRLTNHRGIDTSPSWSPTGREIAFTSDRGGTPQVYVMDREGGSVRRLTYEVSFTDSPSWSPRGDKIAFVSRAGRGFDVYTVMADGNGAQLIASGGSNENPRWSPDGRHLVFASNRDGSFGLWVSDLDGTPPRKLDTGGRVAVSPAWSPRPAGDGSAVNLNVPINPGR